MDVIIKKIWAALLLCLLLWGLLPLAAQADSEGSIYVLSVDNNTFQQNFAILLKRSLKAKFAEYNVREIKQLAAMDGLHKDDLILTVGTQSAAALYDHKIKTPCLHLFVTRKSMQDIPGTANANRQCSVLYLEQPPARYIHLLVAALPDSKKLGILLGPDSSIYRLELEQAMNEAGIQGLSVFTQDHDDIESSLRRFDGHASFILTLPDKAVVSARTAKKLILDTFMNHKGLIGYSESYIKAGALMGVYSTPDQINKNTLNIVRHLLSSEPWDVNEYYPDRYTVSVNYQVARGLGIRLPAEEVILKNLQELEAR